MLPLIPQGGSGGVTDHGDLTGLGDNDHPQYLLTTAKAADSDKLDNLNSTDFVLATALTRYAVRAYRDNTAFTFTTSGTIYTVGLNQEIYDTHAQHDNSINNTRLTCVKDGMYIINAILSFAANTTGNRDLLLLRNGTEYIGQQRLQAFASGVTYCNVCVSMPLAVNDYIEMQGRQYSGGSLGIYYANTSSNWMSLVRIGD